MTPTPTPFYEILSTGDPVVQFLLNVGRALVVLAVALVLAGFARRWVVRFFTRRWISINQATLLGNLAQVAVVVLGIVAILPSFGVDWTGLLTLVGAAGLAISLSLQDVLKNVVAGMYILIEQPFRIGDRISVKDATGVVQGIELRTTILRTDDNLQVIVPNNLVLTEILTNRSTSDLQRQTILVSIKQDNLSEIGRQISKILEDFPEVAHTPAPVTALEELKYGTARLRVEFWSPKDLRLRLTAQVAEALQAHFAGADVSVV